MNAFLTGMLIPIPNEYIDQVFLYITYYITALISPANLIFSNAWYFYALSFLFFAICLSMIVMKFDFEDSFLQVILSYIPVVNLVPMIRIPDWPIGSILLLVPSMSAIAISVFYTFHSEKFSDIYYDIYAIATILFIFNFALLWSHIAIALRRSWILGVFVMVPILNVIMLLVFAFGKVRPIWRHPELARMEDHIPRLR